MTQLTLASWYSAFSDAEAFDSLSLLYCHSDLKELTSDQNVRKLVWQNDLLCHHLG